MGLCILGGPYLFEYILDHAYERLAIVGREVFGGVYESNDRKAAELAVKKLRDFQSLFGVNKKLRELGVKEEDIPKMAETAYRMMKGVIDVTPGGNLSVEDLEEIYRRAY
ncbi:iron-containing alcohol dehydrogenase [Thermococcus sp. JCM 11816]|uniref:iron-containing alcohol dehydrogenase n=1 Tax=Thermococcus sp. (strain JCM 11816 / KS-1) TaxID=1295125 RepID=UPI000AFA4D7D